MAIHPCFISFRHYGDEVSESFIRQFEECLTAELNPLINGKIFIDYARLQPGYSLDNSISEALKRSVCMIVIWSPQYFTKDHVWCATEFLSMIRLETERLTHLPIQERNKKLIIPVIYRGRKYYPTSLNDTLYLDFEKFSLYHNEMKRNVLFADDIKRLAEYIYERWRAFVDCGYEPWDDDVELHLPQEKEVLDFIDKFAIKKIFPLR